MAQFAKHRRAGGARNRSRFNFGKFTMSRCRNEFLTSATVGFLKFGVKFIFFAYTCYRKVRTYT